MERVKPLYFCLSNQYIELTTYLSLFCCTYPLSPSSHVPSKSPASKIAYRFEFAYIYASFVPPGNFATTYVYFNFALQIANILRLCPPFLLTYKCSCSVGAVIWISVPSIAPITFGILPIAGNSSLVVCKLFCNLGNWMYLFLADISSL